MIIKSIEFTNFRPFKGNQKLDFTCNNDKNVVVVLAQNTCGKTTLILSFAWCFYGLSKFDNPSEILNSEVVDELSLGQEAEAKVEIVLSHEGTDYFVKRSYRYRKAAPKKVDLIFKNFSLNYVNPDGEIRPYGRTESEKLEKINAIMPEDLSEYFFFEGEKKNSVTKKDIGDAVKKLLGLDTYANIMKHLHGDTQKVSKDSVMGYFSNKMQNNANGQAKISYEEREEAEQLRENKINEKEQCEKNQIYYQEKIDEINENLREAAPTKELQNKRDIIASNIETASKNLKSHYNDFFKTFSIDSVNLFMAPMFNEVRHKIEQMDLSDKGIKGMDINAINELLGRGTCLCGTELKEGSIAYKTVAAYLDVLPPREVGTYVREMLDDCEERAILGETFLQNFIDKYQQIQLDIQDINTQEAKEEDCLNQLKKVKEYNINELENSLRLYKNNILNNQRCQNKLISEIATLESKIDRLTKEINELERKNETNKKYSIRYMYAQEIYEWVQKTYQENEKEVRTELQNRFENLFNQIYSGHRRAVIDDKFNLHVYSGENELALTGALETIKYFSFVGALVELASEAVAQRNGADDDENFGEYYPLVLDAAFSHTDDYHTKSVAGTLANTTKQLIFAVMDKDWDLAREGIESKIMRTYTIKKISEEHSEIVLMNN